MTNPAAGDDPIHQIDDPEGEWQPIHILMEMMGGYYPHGVVLAYKDLTLICGRHGEGEPNMWHVHDPDGTLIEVINVDAIPRAMELRSVLHRIHRIHENSVIQEC